MTEKHPRRRGLGGVSLSCIFRDFDLFANASNIIQALFTSHGVHDGNIGGSIGCSFERVESRGGLPGYFSSLFSSLGSISPKAFRE